MELTTSYKISTGLSAYIAAVIFAINPLAVIGALIGASLFITSKKSQDYRFITKIILFVLSFACGIGSAQTLCNLFKHLLGGNVEFDLFVGSLMGAALVVLLLQSIIRIIENPAAFIRSVNDTYSKLDNGLKELLNRWR